jgi:signal transduction histidine kinase
MSFAPSCSGHRSAADGRFAGYRGIALREDGEEVPADQPAGLLSDPDALRELVHEVKTPLNAIIGFAEIIEGQYLGPAEQSYRDRAQEIVRQARVLLTAIDDLDFAAKVHSSAGHEKPRVNLGELVEHSTAAVRELARERGVEIDASRATREASAAAEPELARRLILRMCRAVAEQAEAGEHLRLTVERASDGARVSLTRPARLAAFSDEQLLGGQMDLDQGFSLRLVRGLARLAGADLMAPPGSICLVFPRA